MLELRNIFKGKTIELIDKDFIDDKKRFIKHYDILFKQGISDFPGVMELYSILENNEAQKYTGNGFIFKMTSEDSVLFGKDIIKYFLVKNVDIFPINLRVKLSLDSYLKLMELSGVDDSHIRITKYLYYEKFQLD